MRFIELSKTGKKHKGKFKAIVDDIDFDLDQVHWSVRIYKASLTQYAFRKQKPDRINNVYMHRVIAERFLGLRQEMDIDHINRNGLDNRRCNLRYVTRSENKRNLGIRITNTSGEKGVSWYAPRKKFRAYVCKNGKTFYLGYFKTIQEAVAARNEAENKYGIV